MTQDEFIAKYASHLNENQLEAVQAVNGPVLLLAVPGSGKTTVLVHRLGYMMMVQGIVPKNILTLTYTVAATHDMAKRFESVFGDDYSGRLEFRTINGICAKIIARFGFKIGKEPFELLSDEQSTGKIVSDILAKYMSDYPTESDVKGAKTLITYCKNMCLTEDQIDKLGKTEGLPLLDVFKEYNSFLKSHHKMDYDDQMTYAYNMLIKTPDLLKYYRDQYRYICVDEAQDTSKIQHMIINLLAGDDGNIFMVGDEDQSIYGFRAAYPEALLEFEKNYKNAKVLVMDKNYRSNAKIVSAADAFIQRNTARHKKNMISTRSAGSAVNIVELKKRSNQYGYLAKIADNCREETAVLYRDNESVLPLVDVLDRQKIPFRIKNMDMMFFSNRVVLDTINFLRFALNPKDTDLFMKIYFKCKTYLRKSQAEQLCKISKERDIPVFEAIDYMHSLNSMVVGNCRGVATNLKCMVKEEPAKGLFRIEVVMEYGDYLERNGIDTNKFFILKQLAYNEKSITGFLNRLQYLQGLLKSAEQDKSCKFILSTIHSSKGLEYKRVFLMDVCDGVFPSNVVRSARSASSQELKEFEEERRLFYVGMTRAKDTLSIFKISEEESCFISELQTPIDAKAKPAKKRQEDETSVDRKNSIGRNVKRTNSQAKMDKLVSDYELTEGEIVVSDKYGKGAVCDVEYDSAGRVWHFGVLFESGEMRAFLFPWAFQNGMRLDSGVKITIKSN